ncbi:MAG TPA: nucleotide-binding protein [Micromonosporaceae bacterium]
MAARRKQPDRAAPEPHLTIPLHRAKTELQERIDLGNQLLINAGAMTVFVSTALEDVRNRYYTWTEYNEAWLRRNIGLRIAEEYHGTSIGFGGRSLLPQEIREHNEDVSGKIRRLTSIIERLPLWTDEPAPAAEGVEMPPDAPIFVVHGHDHGRAQEVARVLERVTGRDAVILHEQANQGRTLLEKFEAHAASAAFAVVLLTGDDEGRKAGTTELQPRGRQNVIFELGFFFGQLGRSRVMVLVDRGVEHPSDIVGLVYEVLDAGGAWKRALARELEAAKISVNHSKMP